MLVLLVLLLAVDLQPLGQAASRLRGLPYQTVAGIQVKLKDVDSHLKAWLRNRSTPEQDERWDAFLKLLELMPPDRQPFQERFDLAIDQVQGLYDPGKKQFFVVSDRAGAQEMAMGVPADAAVTVHELCHALQDQRFNLTALRQRVARNFDQAMALECLVEGDANSVMVDYLLDAVGQPVEREPSPADPSAFPLTPAMQKAPRFFRESLILPYLQGQFFVETLRRRGRWAAVNSAYEHLPRSTEQIFHPEKYPQELPEEVVCNFPPCPGFRSLGRDTAGEFTLRCWALERGASEQVAWGWAGDQFEVFRGSDGSYLVWVTVWDTPGDAREFAEFVARAVPRARLRHDGREVVLGCNLPREFEGL